MARRRSKLDTEIQHLYGLPLGEFTAARNTLAKQLKKGGDQEGAGEVASLPKPSVSAWAVNHLFTVAPEQMEELLASGDHARKALQQILSGGDPGTLRDAIQEARDLANELRDRAAGVLSKDGSRPGQAIVDRIATNLQSLAFSPAAEPQIERGWLDVDLPPPGFEVLAGLQIAATAPRKERPVPAVPAAPAKPAPKPAAKPEPAKPAPAAKKSVEDRRREEERKEEERAREQREKEEARTQERRDRLEAQHRERLSRAQTARDEAAGRADFLRRKAEQAEKTAEDIRERLAEAERIAEDARSRAKEADKELAKADKAVRAARR